MRGLEKMPNVACNIFSFLKSKCTYVRTARSPEVKASERTDEWDWAEDSGTKHTARFWVIRRGHFWRTDAGQCEKKKYKHHYINVPSGGTMERKSQLKTIKVRLFSVRFHFTLVFFSIVTVLMARNCWTTRGGERTRRRLLDSPTRPCRGRSHTALDTLPLVTSAVESPQEELNLERTIPACWRTQI